MLDQDKLRAAIEAMPGERVTEEYIMSRIKEAKSTVVPDTTSTVVTIELDNGFCVHGTSACVDPANFNAEVGETIAYQDAFRQLWPLFGFLLAEVRHNRGHAA